METPEFIYFDLGKVLLDFSHEVMCRQMGAAVGIDEAAVQEIMFGGGLSQQYESGLIDSDQFCELFFDQANARCSNKELLVAGSDIFMPIREMVPLVATLATSGMPLGILSNTCAAHWELVTDGRYSMLPNMFSQTALSFELGAMKPLPKIYEAAIGLAGVTPSKIFFVDDRQENVDSAVAAGLDAHLFTSPWQVQELLIKRRVRFNY